MYQEKDVSWNEVCDKFSYEIVSFYRPERDLNYFYQIPEKNKLFMKLPEPVSVMGESQEGDDCL